MSAQYCDRCKGPFGTLIEMEVVYDGIKFRVHRCPVCMNTRKERFRLMGSNQVSKISPEQSAKEERGDARKQVLLAGLLIGASIFLGGGGGRRDK